MLLQGHHRRDAELAAGDPRLDQAVAGVVRPAEPADLPGPDEGVHGQQRLLERHRLVVDVQEEQVDGAHVEPAEGVIHRVE